MTEDAFARLQAWAVEADLRIEKLERHVRDLDERAIGLQHQIRHLKEAGEEARDPPKIDRDLITGASHSEKG